MEIFIGNLPGTATLVDLYDFIGDVDLRADFQCHRGHDCEDRPYHFFVARAATREEGLALIARLNGRWFEGRWIEAREYRRRGPRQTWGDLERRVNPW